MSITDELRKWAHEHVVYGMQTTLEPPTHPLTFGTKEEVLSIADRIDEEHEKAIRELNGLAEVSVLLPVDADGVPIRVGDVLDPPDGCDDYEPLQVMRLTYDGWEDEWFFDGEAGGFCGMVGEHMDVAGWTHHHASTVEDVLDEFANAYDRIGGSDEEHQKYLDLIAEYAAKLQLKENA